MITFEMEQQLLYTTNQSIQAQAHLKRLRTILPLPRE